MFSIARLAMKMDQDLVYYELDGGVESISGEPSDRGETDSRPTLIEQKHLVSESNLVAVIRQRTHTQVFSARVHKK